MDINTRKETNLPHEIIFGNMKDFNYLEIKNEIEQIINETNDKIILITDNDKYDKEVKFLNGVTNHLNVTSLINICDCITPDKNDTDYIPALYNKCDIMVYFLKSVVGTHTRISDKQLNIINQKYIEFYETNKQNNSSFTLKDFFDYIINSNDLTEDDKKEIKKEINGEYKKIEKFNGYTEIQTSQLTELRLCDNYEELSLFTALSYINNLIYDNRNKDQRFWIFIDFDYCLANNQDVCTLLLSIHKRARMSNINLTYAFKGVMGLFEDIQIRDIINNSDCCVISKKCKEDAEILKNNLIINYHDYTELIKDNIKKMEIVIGESKGFY